MSLKASTRSRSESRPVSTECPIPAAASTATDSADDIRTAQRGPRLRGDRRDGRGGTRRAGERGGVDKGTPPRGRALRTGAEVRAAAGRGILSTVGPYDLRTGAAAPAARTRVPRSR
ncbi:hypothetical protein GCM10010259_04980 [Streptomyces daghestanicus]|nr:hypothetical protein GCM10010259_04980 [Streptomyces daghestanicus]